MRALEKNREQERTLKIKQRRNKTLEDSRELKTLQKVIQEMSDDINERQALSRF